MPNEMREFIETRINTGEYQSASDYLRDLIRHDQQQIEHYLVEGLESGEALPLDINRLRDKASDLIGK